MIARTCACGKRVEAGQRCDCKPRRAEIPQAERRARQPWRKVYTLASYVAGRVARYLIAHGRCESCGVPLKGELHPDGVAWECDHRIPARRFADLDRANDVRNLRCLCVKCHRKKRRGR